MGFSPFQELIAEMSNGLMVNLKSANKNVPQIGRRIWVVKERYRDTRHIIPFTMLPVLLTINIVLNNVKILGYYPTTVGILTTISTREIMTGNTLNYKRNMEITFWQYLQIQEKETPCNSTRTSTRGTIWMGTSGNKKGGFKFITLGYMKKVVRWSWYAISMPDTIFSRANTLGQGQPNDIDFLDCKKRSIWELNITGVDSEETEAPHIELI